MCAIFGLLTLLGSGLIGIPVPWLALTQVSSPVTSPVADVSSTRDQLRLISDYVVYYGQGRMDDLARFDLAIIQPETLDAGDRAELRASGTLVVAYLSLGEVEPYRPWYDDGRVNPDWILGENPNWGSYYIDTTEAGWQALMVDIAGDYLAQGFDGIFMDTLDTVDLFPETTPGMIATVEALRKAYPQALLIQNRGFTVLDATAPSIDALMFEDLSTSYNFDTDTYITAENDALAARLSEIKANTGLVILALDYVAPGDTDSARRARDIARSYGFIPAVAEITLETIPDYDLDTP